MSDSDGMKEPYHQFTISNICEDDWASYQINLESLSETTLNEEYIKANLSVDGVSKVTTKLENKLQVETTIDGAVRAFKLLTGILKPHEEITYDLRIWMHGDVTSEDTDSMNKTYQSKISVEFSYMKEPNYLVDSFSDIERLASKDENVCGDNGIVQVSHADAEIANNSEYETLGLDFTEVEKNLKMTEYRYCGENPNNYVTFNGEVAGWRIIGLVNTPEGQRIKIIRATPLEPSMSWDNKPKGEGSSYSSSGSNDWSDARLQLLLNKEAYYNRTSGTCYNGYNNSSTECDFGDGSKTPGLTEEAKKMIDKVTWNLGGNTSAVSTKLMYNYERGTKVYTSNSLTRLIMLK